jgi:hypothetical protein
MPIIWFVTKLVLYKKMSIKESFLKGITYIYFLKSFLILTLFSVNILVAIVSGKINIQINQPHANNFNDISCHNATNVNTINMLNITYFDPPSGT